MTENKQALSDRETLAQKSKGPQQQPKIRNRVGAVAIRWLVILLVVVIGLVLLFNRMAKSHARPSDKPAVAAKIPEGPVVKLADVNELLIGSSVTVAGKVLALFPPPAGSTRPYGLKIADASGEKTITFWQMEYDQIQGKETLDGANIRARVAVSSYQDKLQLKLTSGADLEIVAGPATAATAMAAPKEIAPRDFSRGRAVQANSLSVGSVTAAMDGQTVVVRGRVDSVSSPKEGTKQPFSVVLKDGTASLRVVYWPATDEVIAVKPTPGTTFEMEGVVSVYEGTPQLKVESGYTIKPVADMPASAPVASPAAVVSQPAGIPSQAVSISSITAAQDGQTVVVRGRVESVSPPKEGTKQPFAVMLKDGEASMRVVYWPATDEVIAVKPTSGATFEMEGVVSVYEGTPQLKVESGYTVKPVADMPASALVAAPAAVVFQPVETPSQAVPISSITAAQDGQTVVVRGRVESVSPPKEGTKQPFAVMLKDGEASMRVVYWPAADEVIAVKPTPGATFEIEGVVSVYEGTPQLKVESGYKVKKVADMPVSAPSATPAEIVSQPAAVVPPPAAAVPQAGAEASPVVAISSITAADKGQTRVVKGILGASRSIGKGVAFPLTDESGTMDIILWESDIPAEVRGALSEGMKVSATGEVSEFNGKLQIKAAKGQSVVATP